MLQDSHARGPRRLRRLRRPEPSAVSVPASSLLARFSPRSVLHSAVASFASVVFPAPCRICGEPLENLSRLPVCDGCLHSLTPLADSKGSFCEICGDLLASPWFAGGSAAAETSDDRSEVSGEPTLFADAPLRRCGLCQKAQPPYQQAVAFGSYDDAVRDLVHLLKYEHVLPAAAMLAELLTEALQPLLANMAADTIVIPVPLHAERRRERGFNQAEKVLDELLKQLRCEPTGQHFTARLDVLARTRATRSQTGLTRPQRKANVKGAFKVKNQSVIAGRDVLLIDDVFTTGTTVAECARVLKRAGAARVWVATVARVLKDEVSLSAPLRGVVQGVADSMLASELPVAYRPMDPKHSGLF